MTEFMKREIQRWWRNLDNGLKTAIQDNYITEESTIAELFELCKDKIEEFSDDN